MPGIDHDGVEGVLAISATGRIAAREPKDATEHSQRRYGASRQMWLANEVCAYERSKDAARFQVMW